MLNSTQLTEAYLLIMLTEWKSLRRENAALLSLEDTVTVDGFVGRLATTRGIRLESLSPF